MTRHLERATLYSISAFLADFLFFLRALKSRRVLASAEDKIKLNLFFRRDMCVPENTSRPVNVRLGTRRALQQAASPFCKGGLPAFAKTKKVTLDRPIGTIKGY